jgi:hypothetical protein
MGDGEMTAKSSSPEGRRKSFWSSCLVFTGIYTLFWLYPALTDWVPRALFGTYDSFPDLGPYGFVDTVAFLLLKHGMWLLSAMVLLNVMATVTCFLAVRHRSFTLPLCTYVAGFIVVGISILFCDIRLYQVGLNDGEDAFVMTLMWCILGAPLWILAAGGMFSLVSKRQTLLSS